MRAAAGYEAHVVTAAGDEVIVQVGKDFTVTGTQTGGPGGHGSGHHGGNRPDGGADSSETGSVGG